MFDFIKNWIGGLIGAYGGVLFVLTNYFCFDDCFSFSYVLLHPDLVIKFFLNVISLVFTGNSYVLIYWVIPMLGYIAGAFIQSKIIKK